MDNSSELARFNMIQQQIRPWGVLDDRVLEVMGTIEREHFVPDAYRALAYADIEIPNSNGTLMLAPKVVGHLLQALAVQPGDRALEIGTGSGYVAACLSRLGARVISLEIDPAQAAETAERLEALKFDWVEVREGDGLAGPVSGAPFDAIAVKGSMPTEDALPMLREQLTIGGRLFCILGTAPAMECVRVTRVGRNDYRRESLFEVEVPPLHNAPEPVGFEF
ncbi:protein-L-isoaspartate O-methyltransferase family protein [Allochromatium palmeri]|uniref:Protein-L-isoaspartate O-methyltransferase n=1 Tax=Allochromatium palmeri TaxID=231048 RepID=A0A6N8EC48_9GAMM|nr:protein-L-isoaspartate O-methyltransferase [Allochromatium palmeri]MTW21793.1 methyltransferase domain-containing protein [Allochromatium palmeri]